MIDKVKGFLAGIEAAVIWTGNFSKFTLEPRAECHKGLFVRGFCVLLTFPQGVLGCSLPEDQAYRARYPELTPKFKGSQINHYH